MKTKRHRRAYAKAKRKNPLTSKRWKFLADMWFKRQAKMFHDRPLAVGGLKRFGLNSLDAKPSLLTGCDGTA